MHIQENMLLLKIRTNYTVKEKNAFYFRMYQYIKIEHIIIIFQNVPRG